MTTARELSDRLASLLRREHEAMADFLVALADFDEKRVWLELGHGSLFSYLNRELGLSKGAAFFRNTAARLVRRYPEKNRGSISALFSGVMTFATPSSGFPENLLGANSSTGSGGLLPQGEPTLPPESKPTAVEPLTADLRRLHLTVSKRLLDKLSAARDALSHSNPGATHEEILEAGLDLLLAADAKRKAIVAKPRKTPPPSSGDSDYVAADVRRAVFKRDEGRCQVPLASGGICGSTYRVELGHIVSRANGGLPTKENLRCECEVHNQYRADLEFGKAFMDRYRKRRRRTG